MTALRQSPNSATPMENTLRGVPPRSDSSCNARVFAAKPRWKIEASRMIRAVARSVAKVRRSSCHESEFKASIRPLVYHQ